MDAWIAGLAGVFWVILKASAQAAVVALLVLAAIRCFGSRLSPAWRHLLWLLVAVRLAIPFAPGSELSVFNLFPRPQAAAENGGALPTERTGFFTAPTPHEVGEEIRTRDSARPAPVSWIDDRSAFFSEKAKALFDGFVEILPLLWLAGALLAAARLLSGSLRFWRSVRSLRSVTDPGALALLEECRAGMGVRIPVALHETGQVSSPALLGALRPRILLPSGTIAQFSEEELRCVFLHELAHLKRCDILIGWALAFLSVLHWFNPLVRLAFRRAWAEREEACDLAALSRLGEGAGDKYGGTLIKILERAGDPQPLVAVVGILEDQKHMERRIRRIAGFRGPLRWSILAPIALAVLVGVGLTDSKKKEESDPAPKAGGSIEITIAEDGAIALEGKPATLDELPGRLKELFGKRGANVQVCAHPKLSIKKVMEVVKIANGAGAQAVGIGTVMAADGAAGTILVNVGREGGMAEGQSLIVSREGVVLAKIRITQVDRDWSAATVVQATGAGEIHVGDAVGVESSEKQNGESYEIMPEQLRDYSDHFMDKYWQQGHYKALKDGWIQIMHLDADAEARKFGLREKDVVKAVNGTKLEGLAQITQIFAELSSKPVGEYVLEVEREGKPIKIRIRVKGPAATPSDALQGMLDWLARHQGPGGGWDSDGFDKQCTAGRCAGKGSAEWDVGLTGLSVLAFFGDGQTQNAGAFQANVKSALGFLLKEQKADGCFGDSAIHAGMYNHAISAYAVAEAYAMTKDPKLKEPLGRAVKYLLDAQNPGMGWRYRNHNNQAPSPDEAEEGINDTSVTGWAVLALSAAKGVGIEVPKAAFDGANAWLDSVQDAAPGRTTFGYMRANCFVYRRPYVTTAIGASVRQMTGNAHGVPGAIAVVTGDLPDPAKANFYQWYHGSRAMFQAGGEGWKTWREKLLAAIPTCQAAGEGCDRGSVDPAQDGAWGDCGGRVYTTAMAALCLEIYQRK